MKFNKEKVLNLNKTFNMFTTMCEVKDNLQGCLSDYSISVKDAICVKGVESTAGSAILKGYKPLFDATVVEKIRLAGGTIVAKSSQDEFGFGTFCTNIGQGLKIPKNPLDDSRVTGGSSGGAASAVALIDKHIAVAESTGGSIVTPASFCGVVGLCPTYGRVSRNGLISYGASLDKIGVMSRKVYESALLLEVISGYDEREETSSSKKVPKFTKNVIKTKEELRFINGKKIAVLNVDGVDLEVKSVFDSVIDKLKNFGCEVKVLTMPFTEKYALAAYYIIAMSEASTHLSCLCGIRYGATLPLEGNFDEYFTKVRTTYFNNETKRRILLGTFARMSGYRGQYYVKALKARTKIIEEYKQIFSDFDVIMTPTTPSIAPKFEEIEKLSPAQEYALDFLTVGPNIAGIPHITVPVGRNKDNNMPMGLMVIGNHFEEEKIIEFASAIEVLR